MLVKYIVCDKSVGFKMKVIAAVNNKGGVGKTTVSKLLTEYIASIRGLKTLAIDMDAQCNFSNRFLKMEIDTTEKEGKLPPIHPEYDAQEDAEWDGRSTIADIFFSKLVYPYPTRIKNLDILPANSSKLLLAEQVRRAEVIEKVHAQLEKFLNLTEVKEAYDVVIIDTPPSKGPLTSSVIRAATDILIPSIMEPQPIEGIYGMLQLWRQEQLRRDTNNPLNLIGILPNKFKSISNLHQGYLKSLENNKNISDFIIPAKLCDRLIYAEVDAEGAVPQSVFDLSKNHVARIEVMQALDMIGERIFGNG